MVLLWHGCVARECLLFGIACSAFMPLSYRMITRHWLDDQSEIVKKIILIIAD